MNRTSIEWTEATWNPVTGCTEISPGCARCYAKRMATRLAGRAGYPAEKPFAVTLHPERLEQPLRLKKPTRIFVCSMGDLFHDDVPADFIVSVYEVMEAAKQHTFIICTKRPQRLIPVLYGEEGNFYLGGGDYLPNVWHLVSAENQEMADRRVPELLKLREDGSPGWPVLGVSVEPMLGPINLAYPPSLYPDGPPYCCSGMDNGGCACMGRPVDPPVYLWNGLDWVIAGGETSPGSRPCHPDWVRGLRDQAVDAGVPFFWKGWGEFSPGPAMKPWNFYHEGHVGEIMSWTTVSSTDPRERGKRHHWAMGRGKEDTVEMVRVGKKAAGRQLDGRTWDEMPGVKP